MDTSHFVGQGLPIELRRTREPYGVHFECTQSGCMMNLASNGADLLGQIVAYREPDGTLFVLDRVMMEEQSEN